MKYVLLLNLIFVLNLSFSQEGDYSSKVNDVKGIVRLSLFPNNTYSCSFPSKDYANPFYHHKGIWFQCGDKLILNSFNQPDQDTILNVVKKSIDSLRENNLLVFHFTPQFGFIKYSDFDSVMALGPNYIVINQRDILPIPENGRLETEYRFVHSFYISNQYYISEEYVNTDANNNFFDIFININGLKYHYPFGSYFKNEILQIVDENTFYIKSYNARIYKEPH